MINANSYCLINILYWCDDNSKTKCAQVSKDWHKLLKEDWRFAVIARWIQREGFSVQSSFDQATPLYQQLKLAAAVFIGEVHTFQHHQMKNGELVNQIYDQNSSLWVEGSDLVISDLNTLKNFAERDDVVTGGIAAKNTQIRYVKAEYKETARSWDNEVSRIKSAIKNIKLNLLMKTLFDAIDRISEYLHLFEIIIKFCTKNIKPETRQLYANLAQSSDATSSPIIIDSLKLKFQISLLNDVLKHVKDDHEERKNLIKNTFQFRNELLFSHVIDEIKNNRKAICLAGSRHFFLKKNESENLANFNEIKTVCELMKEKQISYVAFFPHKSMKIVEKQSWNQYLNVFKNASNSEKRKLFRKDVLNKKNEVYRYRLHDITAEVIQIEIDEMENLLNSASH